MAKIVTISQFKVQKDMHTYFVYNAEGDVFVLL